MRLAFHTPSFKPKTPFFTPCRPGDAASTSYPPLNGNQRASEQSPIRGYESDEECPILSRCVQGGGEKKQRETMAKFGSLNWICAGSNEQSPIKSHESDEERPILSRCVLRRLGFKFFKFFNAF